MGLKSPQHLNNPVQFVCHTPQQAAFQKFWFAELLQQAKRWEPSRHVVCLPARHLLLAPSRKVAAGATRHGWPGLDRTNSQGSEKGVS